MRAPSRPVLDETAAVTHGSARRPLLAAMAAQAAIAALGGLRPAAAAPAIADTDAAFMGLSHRLTARTALDPEIGRRLHAMLTTSRPGFDAEVAACAAFADTRAGMPAAALLAALDRHDPRQAEAARAIVAAWYTGVAGSGPKATVIAYRDALMFAAVADVLAVPSYCRGAPGDWTAKPPAA